MAYAWTTDILHDPRYGRIHEQSLAKLPVWTGFYLKIFDRFLPYYLLRLNHQNNKFLF